MSLPALYYKTQHDRSISAEFLYQLTITQMYWVLLRQNRLYTKSALKTTLSEVSCLAPGFDIKLSDDDTECNHFSLLYKHTNCVCVCVFFCGISNLPCWNRECMYEREHHLFCSGLTGAASKDSNQVSTDTTAKLSASSALKSSGFHKYGKQHLCVDSTSEANFHLMHLCFS